MWWLSELAGGNLREGMRLGRFFFQNKIETVVESKTQCASACALAFLGGRDETGKPRRTKASTGGVGFHPSPASSTRTKITPPTISRPWCR
jgi:hypothetical protein